MWPDWVTVEDRKVREAYATIKVLAARLRQTEEAECEVVQSKYSKCKAFLGKLRSSPKRKRALQSVHLGTVEGTVGVHTVYPVKRKKVA